MTPIDAKVNDLLILALHEKRHALQRARRMWSLTPEAEQLLTAVLAKIDELEALEKAPGARPESASVLAERYGFKPRAASGGEALGRDLGHVDAARPEPQAQKTSEEQQRDGLGLAPSQLDHSRPAEASEEPGTSDSAERVAREFCQKHIREFYETSTSSIRFCHELALLLRSDPLGLREQGWNEAVEACAKRFASDWLCLDHGGEEQELIIARCLELARPAAPKGGG